VARSRPGSAAAGASRAETTDLDEQLDRVRGERHAAANAQEYEQAWWLHDREKELLASKAARHEQ